MTQTMYTHVNKRIIKKKDANERTGLQSVLTPEKNIVSGV
jgi:hypothetical protein